MRVYWFKSLGFGFCFLKAFFPGFRVQALGFIGFGENLGFQGYRIPSLLVGYNGELKANLFPNTRII